VIASGGVSSIADVKRLNSIYQLEGVIIGKAIYDKTISLYKLQKLNY
jgi:phosphoribosylformimino-5-aminoimidazole carboxamide ribotide isomerase